VRQPAIVALLLLVLTGFVLDWYFWDCLDVLLRRRPVEIEGVGLG